MPESSLVLPIDVIPMQTLIWNTYVQSDLCTLDNETLHRTQRHISTRMLTRNGNVHPCPIFDVHITRPFGAMRLHGPSQEKPAIVDCYFAPDCLPIRCSPLVCSAYSLATGCDEPTVVISLYNRLKKLLALIVRSSGLQETYLVRKSA